MRARLGGGGFGEVYLARDAELERDVAIKVPHSSLVRSRRQMDALLAEARRMARFEHPGIVSVYDVGVHDETCFIVSQLVDGESLAGRVARAKLTRGEAIEVVRQVADALQHAHQAGLVHRDVKPANILLDRDGRPLVTDFGLAATYEELRARRGVVAGTPRYMAPEQVRGEDHRIDARTDVYALGVLLYELLCGRAPFAAATVEELFAAILDDQPVPPRRVDPTIPPELERICLRAMARRSEQRYPSAASLRAELTAFLEESDGERATAGANLVVPRGLRAFGPEDRGFFLELLPGPRDRHGLPDSIGFWKERIESRSAERAFRVGLLFGPSGCGKSSLLRAGLLPRLDPSVLAIYVEAGADTEARVRAALERETDLELAGGDSGGGDGDGELAEAFSAVRRREGVRGRKLLVVLDQFEQWLHVRGAELESAPLFAALRQCDGVHVQCLLTARDDFWLAASRLFQALEIHMVEDRNVALVDLFDRPHARRVLEIFGRAYGRLPSSAREWRARHDAFLDRAVRDLARDGRVVSVQLSLFADMLKEREWTPATLRDVGGAAGVGVTFLERALGARAAVPEHHALEGAARAVLEALLPEEGEVELKGQRRTIAELSRASGLDRRLTVFRRLLEILDRELHVITPVAAETSERGYEEAPAEDAAFQLTHDYLVPVVREWIARKDAASWRGRNRMRMKQRARYWGAQREPNLLPTALESVGISLAVPRRDRSETEAEMMRAAVRFHALRWSVVLVLLAGLGAGFLVYRDRSDAAQARARVDQVVHASPRGLPVTIANLGPYRERALALLGEQLVAPELEVANRLHAACALAALGEPPVGTIVEALGAVDPSPESCANIVSALAPAGERARAALRERFARAETHELRARIATVLLHLGEADAARELLELGADPAPRTAFVHGYDDWRGDPREAARLLLATEDDAFRSGLTIALGRVRRRWFSDEERQALIDAWSTLYREAPGGGTHSAAVWALRRWEGEAPRLEPSIEPEPGRRWCVTPHGLTLVRIEPGTFTMGDPAVPDDPHHRVHDVTLTRAFLMSTTEVSLELWRRFLADPEYDPARRPEPAEAGRCNTVAGEVTPGEVHPATNMTWVAAVQFCNWLSVRERLRPVYSPSGKDWLYDVSADGYRLPTEAEWEYACRAGTTTRYYFGDDDTFLEEYCLASNARVLPALPGGSLIPSGWGLFDLHGNVWEWCWDYYRPLPGEPEVDPLGPDVSPLFGGEFAPDPRVQRGGGVNTQRGDPASTSRGYLDPQHFHCGRNLGFRVARTVR